MIIEPLDSPQKLANYVTDNAQLQAFFAQYATLKNTEEKKQFEKDFWEKVSLLSKDEQTEIRQAHRQGLQRLIDRTGSVIHFLKEELTALPI